MSDRVAIGYVARAHGVRGELRVHLHDPASNTLYDTPRIFVGGRELVVDSVRPTSGALLVKLEGVDDRTRAESLAGQPVEVVRAAIPLEDGEFLVGDLPGCVVVDTAGTSLGTIVSIMHGPQDLLVIHDATHERLLPLVPAFLVEVDLAARRVVVDPPDELPAEPLRAPPRPSQKAR
jgi:16S rRNA processing protein RimM